MSRAGLEALAPLAIAAAAAVALLVLVAVRRRFGLVLGVSLAASGLGVAAAVRAGRAAPLAVAPLFVIDGYALFFIGLFFAALFVVFLLAASYFRPGTERREEFFLLGFVALLGASTLAASVHFVSLFLGLEILSVSLYALIAFTRGRRASVEAGIKYLVLASAAAAFLLFGGALVYAETGGLDFATWAAAEAAPGGGARPLFAIGVSLMIVGLGFKLAVVPFHMWTPDVYEGAPAPAAAIVATISKGGMLAFLLRFFGIIGIGRFPALVFVFSLIAAASMIAGNLLALRQGRVKRILAYSSISHMGALLVAFLAGGAAGPEAAAFYLAAYVAAMAAAFGAVGLLGREDADADSIEDFRGLFWSRPAAAGVLTLALLSLAGLPLTAGFLGKFYVAAAGVGSSQWTLVAVLVATSVAGLYYYLRVIAAMAARPREEERAPTLGPAAGAGQQGRRRMAAAGIALVILTLALIGLGLFPSGLIGLIKKTAVTLAGALAAPGAGGGGP